MSAAASPSQPARPAISFKILGLAALLMVGLLGFNIFVATRHRSAPATTVPVPTPISLNELNDPPKTSGQGTPIAGPGAQAPSDSKPDTKSAIPPRSVAEQSRADAGWTPAQARRAERLRALQSDAIMVDQAPPAASVAATEKQTPPVPVAVTVPAVANTAVISTPAKKAKKQPLRSALRFVGRRLEFLGIGAADRYTTVPY